MVLVSAKTKIPVRGQVEEDQLSIDLTPRQSVAIRVRMYHDGGWRAHRAGARARSAQSSAIPIA
jgi:hypothetical protein